MDKLEIENIALSLQRRIWEQRTAIWPDQVPSPLGMLDPEIAAHVLGIQYEHWEELTPLAKQGKRVLIAGLLDRQARKIAVSDQFPDEIVRFTGAHEIGHWLLHPGQVMHRDLPIKGLGETLSRMPQEKEADYFAACFLMPRKLVKMALETTFLVNAPFVLDDNAAFWLCPHDPDSLLRADVGSLDCALSLAAAKSYGGRHFNSLAKQFRVSVKTMAIRLKELELIQE
ncbi:ImmA/IrrE family metallo-endopeptidase [Sulfuricella sp.]|uniref:ImmA/IrrE family metallo-endopeptidase n=1 Tax=Sulfuricella sp. TaxID=2099377 RepID=UPI002C88EEAA|nr:ImmA/IrrE family metallo-endopeptidase [Sulfuricella sp.]HUX63732.1 ImmA/IrrE family metallo-endopeptidase [Sulfuricella sp.]